MIGHLAFPDPADIHAVGAGRIQMAHDELAVYGATLVALGTERRCDAILAAAGMIRQSPGAIANHLDTRVAPSAGLSPEMVRWAVSEAVGGLMDGGLHDIVRTQLDRGPDLHPSRPACCHIVLAGNVFTACLQPAVLALALGIPVFCKSASEQSAFPLLLQWALSRADPDVARAFQVTDFPRDDRDSVAAFVHRADLVVAYGGDETMRTLRCETSPATRLIEHGHGVSVGFIGADRLADVDVAHGLAIDIAAYDQRGCLSPQIVWLDSRASHDAKQGFLHHLDDALAAVQKNLPRGPLAIETAARQMQWRAVAAFEGLLLQAADHAIAYAPFGQLPTGPQARNILVRDCNGPLDLAAKVARFGIHLKQIGVACSADEIGQLANGLARNQAPRICAVGEMQKPPFDAFCEGLHPASGFLKWVQVAASRAS